MRAPKATRMPRCVPSALRGRGRTVPRCSGRLSVFKFGRSEYQDARRLLGRRITFFFAFGTLPMRGSPAAINSHARKAASSKSGASAGRTCQPVTSLPSTPIERIFGNSPRRLSWWSTVVASHTPLSLPPVLSRRTKTIFSFTYTARHPNIGFVRVARDPIASRTNSNGIAFRALIFPIAKP